MKEADPRISIQQEMHAAFPAYEERLAKFYHMHEYQLGWRNERLEAATFDPGKLLRPRLALMACKAVGGQPQLALPLAAGIQLVHDFSLIHDDIEDNSDMRRGRPTVWALWGIPQGINTGDSMLIIAHLAVHRLFGNGLPPELLFEVLQRFDETILTVCEGQFLDLSYEGNLAISADDYLAMIRRKTAALIAAATGLGARIGGADPETTQAMFDFGLSLGLAFQIQDDVLGIWGDPEITGKPLSADLYRRKLSLPIIYALAQSEQRARLTALYSSDPDDAEVSEIHHILDQVGARAYTEQKAIYFHGRAIAALDTIATGDSQTLAELRALTNSLLGRKA